MSDRAWRGAVGVGSPVVPSAPPPLEFRKAAQGDVGDLVDLRLEFMQIVKDGGLPDEAEWRAELSERFSRELASGEFVAWICLDGRRIVATSGLSIPAGASARSDLGLCEGEALLCNMYTVFRYRRRGLGTELLERSIAEARAAGVRAIRLQPTADSLALYLRRGFLPAPGCEESEELILTL